MKKFKIKKALILLLMLALFVGGMVFGASYSEALQLDTYQTERVCNFYTDNGSSFILVMCEDGTWWNASPYKIIASSPS